MFDDRPEELPPLHQDLRGSKFALLQTDLEQQWVLDLVFESNEQFSIKRTKGAAVSKLLKSGSWFLHFQNQVYASSDREVAVATLRLVCIIQSLNKLAEGKAAILISSASFCLVPPRGSRLGHRHGLREQGLGASWRLSPTGKGLPYAMSIPNWDRLYAGNRTSEILDQRLTRVPSGEATPAFGAEEGGGGSGGFGPLAREESEGVLCLAPAASKVRTLVASAHTSLQA